MSAAITNDLISELEDEISASEDELFTILSDAAKAVEARRANTPNLDLTTGEVKFVRQQLQSLATTQTSDRTDSKTLNAAKIANQVLQDLDRTLTRVKENLPVNGKIVTRKDGTRILNLWFYLDPPTQPTDPTQPKRADYSARNRVTYTVINNIVSTYRNQPKADNVVKLQEVIAAKEIVKRNSYEINPTPWSDAGQTDAVTSTPPTRTIGSVIYQHPAFGRFLKAPTSKLYHKELGTICTELNVTPADVADVLEARNLQPKYQPTPTEAIAKLLNNPTPTTTEEAPTPAVERPTVVPVMRADDI